MVSWGGGGAFVAPRGGWARESGDLQMIFERREKERGGRHTALSMKIF